MDTTIKFDKQFSLLSYEITTQLSNDEIKKNGIYFTPYFIIKRCIDRIKELELHNTLFIQKILEPCCGSCEFLLLLDEYFNGKNIDAIEKNISIYDKTQHIQLKNNKLKHVCNDFLHVNETEKYDLIIGNPPYNVLNKNDISEKYFKYFDGRPNIFILFIIECLKKLNKDGLLCFVLPINFLNCLYYDKTRNYIHHNFKIHDIILIKETKFMKTKQDVFILIIQNTHSQNKNKNYVLKINNNIIFHDPLNLNTLKEYTSNCTYLNKLNFRIRVGNVIWNEHKRILTDDATQSLLIYNNYIQNNNLEIVQFKNQDKKNYIQRKGVNTPIIIINRGYGMGKYNFNYALIDIEQDYCVENHCLILEYQGNKSKDEAKKVYEKIIHSFENPKTHAFIDIYFKNNAINKEELLNILPIYDF